MFLTVLVCPVMGHLIVGMDALAMAGIIYVIRWIINPKFES